MKTVLITGANGFIGHYLVEEFVKDYRVVCVVRPGSTNMVRLEKFVNDKKKIIFENYDNIIPQWMLPQLLIETSFFQFNKASRVQLTPLLSFAIPVLLIKFRVLLWFFAPLFKKELDAI